MLRQMDPAQDNLADNEEIQVRSLCIAELSSLIHEFLGALSVMYEFATKDSQANRQIQPETRFVAYPIHA